MCPCIPQGSLRETGNGSSCLGKSIGSFDFRTVIGFPHINPEKSDPKTDCETLPRAMQPDKSSKAKNFNRFTVCRFYAIILKCHADGLSNCRAILIRIKP